MRRLPNHPAYRKAIPGKNQSWTVGPHLVAVLVVLGAGVMTAGPLTASPLVLLQSESATSQLTSDPMKRIERAIDYLFSRQSADGSWKSAHYGNLKQGAAITSLVLFSVSHAPPELLKDRQPDINRAFKFLRAGIAKHGYVANLDGPDYANYATALTLLADSHFAANFDWTFLSAAEKKQLVAFLCDSQLDETHGLTPDDDNYGGWDLSGWMREPRLSPGTNISITSFVLWALRSSEDEAVEAARRKAAQWLTRVENADHGFYFHPQKDHSGNKAEWRDPQATQPLSYGTATVDGLRAFRALGERDSALGDSAGWLLKHTDDDPGLTFVPGFKLPESGRDGSWGQGLLYYYLAGLALEQESLPEPLRRMGFQQIPRYLSQQQRADGRWENSSSRMREDDPLIATSFALIALSRWSR